MVKKLCEIQIKAWFNFLAEGSLGKTIYKSDILDCMKDDGRAALIIDGHILGQQTHHGRSQDKSFT